MTKIIDPWDSELVQDYTRLIKDFHLDSVNAKNFKNPNRNIRRNTVFASIGMAPVLKAIKEKKPFYCLTGIMPSGEKIHLGTKLVVENAAYFQSLGAKTFVLVADLEAAATRNVSLEEAKKRALEFHIPAYIALGLDPKKTTFYFQSDNLEVMRSAPNYAKMITMNQFKALYGTITPGKIFSATTQIGDILYPQFKTRMPGVIPVGPDQLPHILLTRDIVGRTKKDKFFSPAGFFNKYTPSLDGSVKMSKSKPESCIELPEDINLVKKKIKRAHSGGRETLELHRKQGAIVEKDMAFELLKQHLIDDDEELDAIYKAYKSGKLLSGEVKEIASNKFEEFMTDFNKKLTEARKNIKNLKFVKY